MAVDTRSLGLLGFPSLEKGTKVPKFSLPPPADLVSEPSQADFEKARFILVQQRRSAPDFKDPGVQRRNTLLSKKKAEARADPNNWKFSLHEVGKALNGLFDTRQATWQSMSIAKALFAAGGECIDAQTLWEHAMDSSLESRTGRMMKKLHNLTSDSAETARCPWLECATRRKDISAVVVLCQAGVRQDSLDMALELALKNKSYAVAEEILRFNAQLPKEIELYAEAMKGPKAPDLSFLMLWMPSTISYTRPFALEAMLTAARTTNQPLRDDMNIALSVLLTNVPIKPDEAYKILVTAIKASNLKAMALVSLAIDMDWKTMQGAGTTATAAAAAIRSSSVRLSVLDFLFQNGAKANTPVLQKQLLKEAVEGNLDLVTLFVHSGVSPCCPGKDSDTLQWAVSNARMDIFDLIMDASIPQEVASSAILHTPYDTSEANKVAIVTSLCQKKGATGQPLSQLLIDAVLQSSESLITTLLTFGATADYINENGRNALYIAIERGDVTLARRLCDTQTSKTIISDGLPLALQSLGGEDELEILCELLSLLVTNGASGTPLEQTVFAVIPTKTWAPVLQRLLPVGMSDGAWGRAVDEAAKLRGPAVLHLICKEAPSIPKENLEAALTEVIFGDSYHQKKAQILAAQAEKQAHWGFLDQLLVGLRVGTVSHRKEAIEILLLHGASVNAGRAAVLVDSTIEADIDHIRQLLKWQPDAEALTYTLEAALTLSNPDRLSIVQILDGHGLSPETRASHFLDATQKRDPELLSVLIGQETVLWDHDDGSLEFAVSQGLVDEVTILLLHGAPRAHIESSFNVVVTQQLYRQRNNIQIAAKLLQQQLSKTMLNDALFRAFQQSSTTLPADFISLLLKYGVDVDVEQGACFTMAAMIKDVHIFKGLAACPFDLTVVLHAFLELADLATMGEAELIDWINILAAGRHGKTSARRYDESMAVLAMKRFPKGQALIARLLDLGFDRRRKRSIPLISALSSNETSDEVILELLSRGDYGMYCPTSCSLYLPE